MLEIASWKGGADFAYSIVYGRAFEVLLRQSAAVHEEFMIPANVAVESSRIGELYSGEGSLYHMVHRHLGREELGRLLDKGWSVSVRGPDDGLGPDAGAELASARQDIADTLGVGVTLLTLPPGRTPLVQAGAIARQCGYLAMFSWLDHVNDPDDDLFCLGRVPLMEEGPRPWRRRFDPYDRLMLAAERGAWLVDSVNCATRELMAPQDEIRVGSLVRRFEKVCGGSGRNVWCATPEEVVDYILTRRTARLTPGKGGPAGNEYVVQLRELDPAVRRRVLTFRASGWRDPSPKDRTITNLTDRIEIRDVRAEKDSLLFNVEVFDGLRLQVPEA